MCVRSLTSVRTYIHIGIHPAVQEYQQVPQHIRLEHPAMKQPISLAHDTISEVPIDPRSSLLVVQKP